MYGCCIDDKRIECSYETCLLWTPEVVKIGRFMTGQFTIPHGVNNPECYKSKDEAKRGRE